MKAKKALKRLVKVEQLLSDVRDRYSNGDHVVHGFLDSASASLSSARQRLDSAALSKERPAKAPASAKGRNGAVRRKPQGASDRQALSKSA